MQCRIVVQMRLRRLVLDVVKGLNKPTVIELAAEIVKVAGVESVNITVNETDIEVMGLTVTVEGSDIDYPQLSEGIEDIGCSIRSVDQVSASKKDIELERKTR